MKKIDVLEMRSVNAGEISHIGDEFVIDIYSFYASFRKSNLGFYYLNYIKIGEQGSQHVYFSPVEFCKKLISWVYNDETYPKVS